MKSKLSMWTIDISNWCKLNNLTDYRQAQINSNRQGMYLTGLFIGIGIGIVLSAGILL